jgi:serine/threonine protein kinase
MSPEQARGEKLDGRTDLYASGIILWELLTGRQLFPSNKPPGAPKDGHTSEEILKRVRNPDLVPPSRRASRVPPELDRISLKALAPELKDRYARCEELRADLATFLAQTSPATDSTRLATFLHELYAEDISAERSERETLIDKARDWYSAKHVISTPSPAKADPKPASPPALKLPPNPLAAKAASPKPALSRSIPIPPPIPPQASGALRPEASKSAPSSEASKPAAPDSDSVDNARERKLTVREPSIPIRELSKGNRSASTPINDSEPALTDSQGGQSTAVLGTVVGGRYYVRRLIGEGGMGRVYEAEHIDIGRRCALKILHPAYSQTPDLVERLRREARAASKIAHPNVVDVTDSGTTPDGAFFFVMEFLEGIELGELIYREKRLDIRRTLIIGTQICRALQAAHEVNVIHRDLKPENVLILRRDQQRDYVKVLDFGIAKSGSDSDLNESHGGQRRLTHPGMTMGTPEYMAPEQASGKPADPRSDVYAVGGLLYEMLSGKPPYEGSNFMEILHKKANTMPAALSTVRNDVPAQLEAIIMRAMAKDPAERPPSMEALERELNNVATLLFSNFNSVPFTEPDPSPPGGVLGGLPGVAVASGVFDRVRGWDRKTKAVVVSGALAGLGLAFILGRIGHHDARGAAPTPPVVAVAPPPPIAPPPPVTPTATTAPAVAAPEKAAEPATDEKAAEDEAEKDTSAKADGDAESPAKTKTPARVVAPAIAGAEAKKMLAEGERMLRAERFAEARGIFEKLAKGKKERGPALVGLAEIAFQEKKYGDAAHAAELAAERGGGVKARVLLGDAHFRLAHYKEAAKAYEDALKIDPGNASAKSGLALANKRM